MNESWKSNLNHYSHYTGHVYAIHKHVHWDVCPVKLEQSKKEAHSHILSNNISFTSNMNELKCAIIEFRWCQKMLCIHSIYWAKCMSFIFSFSPTSKYFRLGIYAEWHAPWSIIQCSKNAQRERANSRDFSFVATKWKFTKITYDQLFVILVNLSLSC